MQNSDRNFLVSSEAFICCFNDNVFLIDNVFLRRRRKYIVKDQKRRKVKIEPATFRNS